MIEYEAGGHQYRSNKLPLMTQYLVAKRLLPALSEFSPLMKSVSEAKRLADASGEALPFNSWDMLGPVGNALSKINDEDSKYVINSCLEATDRFERGAWGKIRTPQGVMMFNDLELPELVQIVSQVLGMHLASFFPTPPQTSSEAA